PGEARAQLGELVGGVTAAEQIEDAFKAGAGESGEGSGVADEVEEGVYADFGLLNPGLLLPIYGEIGVRGIPGLKIETGGTRTEVGGRTRLWDETFCMPRSLEELWPFGNGSHRGMGDDGDQLLCEH